MKWLSNVFTDIANAVTAPTPNGRMYGADVVDKLLDDVISMAFTAQILAVCTKHNIPSQYLNQIKSEAIAVEFRGCNITIPPSEVEAKILQTWTRISAPQRRTMLDGSNQQEIK